VTLLSGRSKETLLPDGQEEKALVGVLNGIAAPPGDGMVIEVHLDIMGASVAFLNKLNHFGFENDPFLDFYPPQYTLHYTGRTRAPHSDVANALRDIRALIAEAIETARAANVRMYVENELVRDIHRFEDSGSARNLSALDDFNFKENGQAGSAKADIHVEFRSGTVPGEVRALLLTKNFYWVRTPSSERFPSEEIATLQTATFDDAHRVYGRLVACPLPACTGIHLEQKLDMIASHPNLPMPVAVEVDHR
jgi:hypothetical protein